ncbi:MAG: lytic murein transglycosylase, partial [Gammaproteobacteria bacterium]|nr:lytic murein transglycosylase [Gammaproteobacteria bacterium]
MKSGLLLSLLLSAFFTLPSYAKAKPAPLPQSIIHYVDKISQQYHFNRDKLLALMQQTHPLPKVVKRLNHPFEKKPWDFYRNYFITTERINHGVKYWHEHAKVLQQTSRKYG